MVFCLVLSQATKMLWGCHSTTINAGLLLRPYRSKKEFYSKSSGGNQIQDNFVSLFLDTILQLNKAGKKLAWVETGCIRAHPEWVKLRPSSPNACKSHFIKSHFFSFSLLYLLKWHCLLLSNSALHIQGNIVKHACREENWYLEKNTESWHNILTITNCLHFRN